MARICILRRAYYPEEYHVRRNAETLVKANHNVDVICLKDSRQKFCEYINGVKIYRLPLKSSRAGIVHYVIEYVLFFILAFIMVTVLCLVKKYEYFEADSMPDFLIFCGLIPKLTGAKLSLYLFESMPELWAQKKKLSSKSWIIRLLNYQETLSCRFADKVICCHELAKEAVVSRGVTADDITVILNVPDESLFNSNICNKPILRNNSTKTINLVQHGTITEGYGIQIVLDALSYLKGKLSIHYHICGKGEFQPHLESLASRLDVCEMVTFHGFVSHEELLKILCSADGGIVPMLYEFQSPNKMFELISLAKPVIASDLKTFKQHFSSYSILYFRRGDPYSLAEALIKFSSRSRDDIQKQVDNATKEFNRYSWKVMQDRYLRMYKKYMIV